MEVLLRYSAKSDPRSILVLFGILALVFAGFAVWYGVKNLRQARTISRHFSLRELKDHIGELVTVFGAPEPLDEVFGIGRARVLWFERKMQRLERQGKHSHWKTVKTVIRSTDFNVCFRDGGKVLVKCRPSEIQGMPTLTSGGGMLGSTRTVSSWLPLYPGITVTGRLELRDRGATVMPDRKFGQFVSGREPAVAAAIEKGKGIAGIGGGALLIATAALLFSLALSM